MYYLIALLLISSKKTGSSSATLPKASNPTTAEARAWGGAAESEKLYLKVAVGPVGDKVQLVLQAAHIPQVVKCPAAEYLLSCHATPAHLKSEMRLFLLILWHPFYSTKEVVASISIPSH